MKKLIALFLMSCLVWGSSARAAETERFNVTVIIASNQGSDFDLENDEYRDQLIELFSYTSYKQVDKVAVEAAQGERQTVALPEGYELVLTYQGQDSGNRALVQAVIRQGRTQHLDTVLSVRKPGVVFAGGPTVKDGVLILVLEAGF